MNEKVRGIISVIVVLAVVALLSFPFVPAFASGEVKDTRDAQTEEVSIATRPEIDEQPWEVTSLDISKDVDKVTASDVRISLEKLASESAIEMMLGDTHDITFTINVDAEMGDSYYIEGNIFVQNTGEWPADVIAVWDTIWYKAGGPTWLAATSNITTDVPIGNDAIPTGGPHVYSYSGTFTLPVPLASVTAMSNLIEITISNKPDPPKPGMQDWTFHYRQDFQKPSGGGSNIVSLEDVETITPNTGLSYEITSVTINGSAASLTGPWSLDLADAPFTVVIEKTLTAEEPGEYVLNNKAIIGDLEDEVDVDIKVKEPEKDKGTIEVYKFEDANASGEIDNGDIMVEGVTIQLWKGDSLVDSKLTDENGHAAFYNLEPGEYTVKEILPEGWYNISADSYGIQVEEGSKEEVKFLNARLARVGGEKLDFADQAPVAGVKFILEGEGFYAEAVSGEDGSFDFGWVMPGEYTLYEELPEGWKAVLSTERQLNLENGEEAYEVFINQKLSAIYGYKWLDVNGDGIHQDDEPALSGVNIILDGEEVHAETVTDENGYFIFEGLEAGQYMVMEEVPEGYYATSAIEVAVDIEDGEEKRVDFLNAALAAVTGTKWLDLNANAQFDAGEEGLAGVTIQLLDAEGEVIESMVTGEDGSYIFEGLKAGEYSVEEIVPDGYEATAPISVPFSLSPGEVKVIDFFNNVQVAAEVIVPAQPAQPEAQQTLPNTGFEMSWLLIMIGLLMLFGAFIASFGLARLVRTR